MNPIVVAETWLYAVLSADTALQAVVGSRIYARLAPPGATYPLVLYAPGTPEDVRGVGVRIMATLPYTVRVIGAGPSLTALDAAAARIDAVLELRSGTVAGGIVLGCRREAPFSFTEAAEGETIYQHLGGIYTLFAQ